MRIVYTGITEDIIDLKIAGIRETVNLSRTFQERWPLSKRPLLMIKTGAYRRPTIIACGVMAFQQLCGFNSLLCMFGVDWRGGKELRLTPVTFLSPPDYSSTIFASAGFNNPCVFGSIISSRAIDPDLIQHRRRANRCGHQFHLHLSLDEHPRQGRQEACAALHVPGDDFWARDGSCRVPLHDRVDRWCRTWS